MCCRDVAIVGIWERTYRYVVSSRYELVYFMVMMKKIDETSINLYNLSQIELGELLASWKEPAFRARQLYRQLYVNLAPDVDSMTDLPAVLRARLKAETR